MAGPVTVVDCKEFEEHRDLTSGMYHVTSVVTHWGCQSMNCLNWFCYMLDTVDPHVCNQHAYSAVC